jgi:hypothetical protein
LRYAVHLDIVDDADYFAPGLVFIVLIFERTEFEALANSCAKLLEMENKPSIARDKTIMSAACPRVNERGRKFFIFLFSYLLLQSLDYKTTKAVSLS